MNGIEKFGKRRKLKLMAKRKENGIKDFFEMKLKEFGIPSIDISECVIKNGIKPIVKSFIEGKINLLVLGDKSYMYCTKLMRLRYLYDLSLSMKFMTQSMIGFNNVREISDVKCIVNLYEESVQNKSSILGSLVCQSISDNSQILLGVRDKDVLEGAFPNDLDTVELNFEVWKLGE
jgi:hypothetical protein